MKSNAAATLPLSPLWLVAIPESITATPIPRPVNAGRPEIPAHTWSAPTDCAATAIIRVTLLSAEIVPTAASAAIAASCAPVTSSTAPFDSRLVIRAPCFCAIASISASVPWRMIRAGAAVFALSRASRSWASLPLLPAASAADVIRRNASATTNDVFFMIYLVCSCR